MGDKWEIIMNKKPDDNVSKYPNNTDTKVALLEMSICHINETLMRFEKRFDKLDEKLDRMGSKIDSRFLWQLSFTIGGFASLLGVIARVAHWI